MFWLHRHLPAKHVLNSKLSAKVHESIIPEIYGRSCYFSTTIPLHTTYIETKMQRRCIRNTISFWERVGIVEKCVWIANRLSLRFSNQMVEIAKKLWLNSLNIYFCKRGGEQRRKCYSKSPPKTLWTCDLKRPKNPWKLPFHSKFLHNFCIPNR